MGYSIATVITRHHPAFRYLMNSMCDTYTYRLLLFIVTSLSHSSLLCPSFAFSRSQLNYVSSSFLIVRSGGTWSVLRSLLPPPLLARS